ncbi:hypothetical protein [Dongshaea marina]|uniref:hypothetical protein n=1 Tax=Dongshaea marina TaxID=2047966 RepID=UPI000D3E6030|nr:hypothetical protein [Dongshaea marina]
MLLHHLHPIWSGLGLAVIVLLIVSYLWYSRKHRLQVWKEVRIGFNGLIPDSELARVEFSHGEQGVLVTLRTVEKRSLKGARRRYADYLTRRQGGPVPPEHLAGK